MARDKRFAGNVTGPLWPSVDPDVVMTDARIVAHNLAVVAQALIDLLNYMERGK